MEIIRVAQGDLTPFLSLLGEIEAGERFEWQQQAHRDWIQERIDNHLSAGTKYFGVLGSSGSPEGVIGVRVDRQLFTETTAEIVDIGVLQSSRRKGLGSYLLAHGVNIAISAGATAIYARTYAADWSVIAFYGRNRMHPVAVIPDTNGPDDEGTIVMRMGLSRPIATPPPKTWKSAVASPHDP